MRRLRTSAKLRLTGILILGGLALPLNLPAPVYLEFEGVEGEVTEASHAGWIEVESFQIGVGTDEGSTSSREHKPLTITKSVDKATPALMGSLVTGETVKNIVLEGDKNLGDGRRVVYYRFEIDHAFITSVDMNHDAAQDSPQMAASLVYPRAEYHVRSLGPDGGIIDQVSTYYDAALNEAGVISQAPIIEQADNLSLGTGEAFTVDIKVTDFDTAFGDLGSEVEANPLAIDNPMLEWTEGGILKLSARTTPVSRGDNPVTISITDGENTRSMSFLVQVDSSSDPFDGFMKAYFSEAEMEQPDISSPIVDPDGDRLSTLLEFLFGTNPREFTPPTEQRTVTPFHISDPAGGGDTQGFEVEFLRRIDDPRIRLVLFASLDGETWTQLESGQRGQNPLYEESSVGGENPLYESVTGTITLPGEATSCFLRFVAEMD